MPRELHPSGRPPRRRHPIDDLVGAACLIASLAGCTSPGDGATGAVVDLPRAPEASAQPAASAPAPRTTAKDVADDAPLEEGRVRFVGMVVPTKGGFDVRGVTMDVGALEAACKRSGATLAASDDLLGAKLRVDAELVREGGDDDDDERVQRRAGTWFRVRTLHHAEVVAPPQSIEGVLSRSKGFYALEGYLVASDDLGWSLAGHKQIDGRRIRLWGQPRTVVCEPGAQCLIEGSLPLFDVGRAELLP